MWFRSGRDIVRFGADGSTASLTGGSLVHESRDGSVWVALHDQYRLVRYHQGVFSDVRIPTGGRRLWTSAYGKQGILAMETDADGELLLLTPAGLVRVVDGRPSPPVPPPLPADGGDLPKVLCLLVDREGNRWVGTMVTGLFRFRQAPLTAYGKDEGLSDETFLTVFEDREGRIWLGGESLYWFDGHRFRPFPGLSDIRAIAQTRNGDLWFGGSGGLYRWRSGVLSRFQIEAPAVNVILEDRQGTLWIVAPSYDRPGGLFRFREEKFERIAADVHRVAEAPDGGLWLANRQGLQYMRGGNTVLYKQGLFPVPDVYQDSTGTLWLANYGGGLIRFRDGRFKAITTKDGLPNDTPVAILEDGQGHLWVSSDRNIFRLSLKELNDFAEGRVRSISPVSYGVAEGMRSSECNAGSPGGWKTRDGRLWFPTVRGVVAIDPTAGNRLPPPVVLEEAWANQLALAHDGRTSVPAGSNTFDFQFTALNLSAAEKQRFKYRLEPYDRDWVDAGTRRTAHYTNMAPGGYSFRVIAANDYGIWNLQGAGVRFVLQPHYYQTNWFYALCACALMALLWAGYQFRLRQLQREFNMRLAERVEERTRIARELHDNLLQTVQGFMLRLQAVNERMPPGAAKDEFEETLQIGDRAIVEGRHTVQDLRSTFTTGDLADAIRALGDELASEGGATFRLVVEGPVRNMHPIVRDEVYSIAREALRNAFTHACATHIEAEITFDERQLRLGIRDDGTGIAPEIAQHGRAGHYGLTGMRERARQIGSKLVISSGAGSGTEIDLKVAGSIAYAKLPGRSRFSLFRRMIG